MLIPILEISLAGLFSFSLKLPIIIKALYNIKYSSRKFLMDAKRYLIFDLKVGILMGPTAGAVLDTSVGLSVNC